MKKFVLATACLVTACSALPPGAESYEAGPGAYRERRVELFTPRPPVAARRPEPRRQMMAAASGRTTAGRPAPRATPVAAHTKSATHGSNR